MMTAVVVKAPCLQGVFRGNLLILNSPDKTTDYERCVGLSDDDVSRIVNSMCWISEDIGDGRGYCRHKAVVVNFD